MALAVDPLCTAALEGRSVIHFTMRNFFGALIDIRRAIVSFAKYFLHRPYRSAAKSLKRQEILPTSPEYLTNQGVIYQAMDQNSVALQSYKVLPIHNAFIGRNR